MERRTKRLLITAAISGFLAVLLGAMGSHIFKSHLELTGNFQSYHTAVEYHFYHTLVLLAIALLMNQKNFTLLYVSGMFTTAGIILFSGCLYLFSLTSLAFLTYFIPLGGLSFLTGWLLFLTAVIKKF